MSAYEILTSSANTHVFQEIPEDAQVKIWVRIPAHKDKEENVDLKKLVLIGLPPEWEDQDLSELHFNEGMLHKIVMTNPGDVPEEVSVSGEAHAQGDFGYLANVVEGNLSRGVNYQYLVLPL